MKYPSCVVCGRLGALAWERWEEVADDHRDRFARLGFLNKL